MSFDGSDLESQIRWAVEENGPGHRIQAQVEIVRLTAYTVRIRLIGSWSGNFDPGQILPTTASMEWRTNGASSASGIERFRTAFR